MISAFKITSNAIFNKRKLLFKDNFLLSSTYHLSNDFHWHKNL